MDVVLPAGGLGRMTADGPSGPSATDDGETPATVPSLSQAVKPMANTTTMRRANEGMKISCAKRQLAAWRA